MDFDAVLSRLEGLEESIITSLLERAQIPAHQGDYELAPNGPIRNENGSLLVSWLAHREKREALSGLFDCPEERPFTKGLAEGLAEGLAAPAPDALRAEALALALIMLRPR